MNERTPKKITAAVLAAVLAVGSVPATTLATTVAAFAEEAASDTVAAEISASSAQRITYSDGQQSENFASWTEVQSDDYAIGEVQSVKKHYSDLGYATAVLGNKVKVKPTNDNSSYAGDWFNKTNVEAYANTENRKYIGTGGAPYYLPMDVKFTIDAFKNVAIDKVDFVSGYGWDVKEHKEYNFNSTTGEFSVWLDACQNKAGTRWNANGEHEIVVSLTDAQGKVKKYSVVIVNDVYDAAEESVTVSEVNRPSADKIAATDGIKIMNFGFGGSNTSGTPLSGSNIKVSPFDKIGVKIDTAGKNYRVPDENAITVNGTALVEGEGTYDGYYIYDVPADATSVEFSYANLIQTAKVTYTTPDGNGNTISVVKADGSAVANDGSVDVGDKLLISATAASGYALSGVKVNGKSDKVTEENGVYTYTVTNSEAENTVAITADFTKQLKVTYPAAIANGTFEVYKLDKDDNQTEKLANNAVVVPGDKLEVVVTPTDTAAYKVDTDKVRYNVGSTDTAFTSRDDGRLIYSVTASDESVKFVAESNTVREKTKSKLDFTQPAATDGSFEITRNGVALAKDAELLEDDVITIKVTPANNKKVNTVEINGTNIAANDDNAAKDSDGNKIANTYTYTVKKTETNNKVIVAATFEAISTKNIYFTAANGKISVQKSDGTALAQGDRIDEETELIVVLEPNEGYTFDDTPLTATNSITPSIVKAGDNSKWKFTVGGSAADITLTGAFRVLSTPNLTITAPAASDGTLVVKDSAGNEIKSGAKVTEGDVLTIVATAKDDNHVVGSVTASEGTAPAAVKDKVGEYTYTVPETAAAAITLGATFTTQATVTIDPAISEFVDVKVDDTAIADGDKLVPAKIINVTAKPGCQVDTPCFNITKFAGTTSKTTASTYTVNAADQAIQVSAKSAGKKADDNKAKGTLTLTASQCTLTVTKNGEEFFSGDEVAEGDVLKITVKARTGYDIRKVMFGGTEIPLTDYTAEYTVPASVASSQTLTAACLPQKAVSVGNLTNGSVVVKNAKGEEVTTAIEGDVLTIVATPETGYKYTASSAKVNGATTNVTETAEKITYTVQNGDTKVEVTATFALKGDGEKAEATVKFAEAKNGTFTVKNSNANVKDGDKVKEADGLTIVPAAAEGFKVAAVKVNDTVIEADKDSHFVYTVLAADKDKELTISVEFEAIITAKLAETKNGTFTVKNGETEVKDGDNIKAGDKLAIEAAPENGYGIASVKVNGTAVEAVEGKYTYEVKADDKTVEIAVEFEVLAPAAVTELKNTARTYNSLTFTWKASEKADSYAVSYKTGNDDWSAAKTVTETTAKLDGLKSNAKYTVRVVALKGTAASEEATAEAETKASAKMTVETPTNGKVSIVRQDGKVLNSGAAITEGIKITIKPTANANYQIDKVMANGKEVTADANGAYVYTVEKVNEFTVSATFKVSAPAAVTGIKATKTGYNSATVTWNKSAVATKYEVSYKTASGSWSTAKTVTTNSAALTGLTANTAYTVRVVAVNGAGKSAAATGAVTTKASPKITFTAPKNGKYTVTRDVDKKVLKSGCNVTEGLGLTIKPTANSGYKVGVVKANGVTLKANANGEYKFNVPKSNAFSISVTFIAVTPAKATGIKVTKSGYNALTVGWNKVANATKYEVSFKTATGSWSKTQTVTGTSAKLSGLTANTKYTVRVIAVNGTVKGAAATANVTTLASPAVKLTTPKNGKVVMTYPNGKTLKSGAHITQGLVLNIKPTANKGYKVAKVVVNGTKVKANAKGQYRYTVGRTNALTVTVTFSK